MRLCAREFVCHCEGQPWLEAYDETLSTGQCRRVLNRDSALLGRAHRRSIEGLTLHDCWDRVRRHNRYARA